MRSQEIAHKVEFRGFLLILCEPSRFFLCNYFYSSENFENTLSECIVQGRHWHYFIKGGVDFSRKNTFPDRLATAVLARSHCCWKCPGCSGAPLCVPRSINRRRLSRWGCAIWRALQELWCSASLESQHLCQRLLFFSSSLSCSLSV